MQLSGARIVATAGALVVVGFALTVVSADPSQGLWMVILYSIVAVAILLLPLRGAAWVATASTVLTALLTAAVFASSSSNQAAVADVLILLLVTLMLGGAALAMHREASRKASSPAE
jgi:hypothetical protein